MPTPNPRVQEAIEKLGMNVRKYRLMRGMTMVKLSEACNLEYTTISKIERGIINTSVSTLVILTKALDVTASQLLED
jgi:transcriptional regulator with XRE-family HTH domain